MTFLPRCLRRSAAEVAVGPVLRTMTSNVRHRERALSSVGQTVTSWMLSMVAQEIRAPYRR